RAALAAQGGDKFKNLKNAWLTGTVNLYAPNSAQSIPGKFSLVTAGPKMRLDVDASPAFKFKQIYDGQPSYSSIPGVQMPPADMICLRRESREKREAQSAVARRCVCDSVASVD